MERVVRPWKRLPRKVVEVSKEGPEVSLSALGRWGSVTAWIPWSGRAFPTKLFCDSMTEWQIIHNGSTGICPFTME